MATRNIDEFNEITGKVFALLYEAFPLPIGLRPTAIGIEEHEPGEYDPVSGKVSGRTPVTEEEIVFGHSVQWLEEAGYLTSIRGQSQGYPRLYFAESRLTAKGLEVLNAMPDNLTKRESIGQQLAEASKSGGKELLRTITTEALGIGVQLGAKAFGL
ncbi:hypothetical protein [Pseudomonas nitroreducens]|uniref:hypothetical protein n=1 Tax=Pseudomonas nitroreducens TaxID=46680 RepID=UPI00351CBAB3